METLDFQNYMRAITALGTILTAFLAVKIYFEVKKIRKSEWMVNINELWNEFNISLLNSDNSSLFEKFVSGYPLEKLEDHKLNAIIFSYLNVVYTIYTAYNNELLENEFAKKLLDDHYEILRRQETVVIKLMKTRGYSESFQNDVFPKKERTHWSYISD